MSLRNALGDLALDDTVQSLKTVSDNILLAVEALNTAVTALSAKTIKSDTDHVSVSNFPSTQAVAIDAASLSALETISVGNFPATQPVSGTVSVSNMVSQGLTDTQLRATDIKVTLDSEAVALDAASLAALETVSIANFPATQPVSGTVAVSNMVSQGLTDTQLRATDVKVTLDGESVSISNQVTQPVTDTQLRASDVKVTLDGEQVAISNFPATQQVSVSSLPLPTGAALESTLSELKTSIDSLNAKVTVVNTGNVTIANPGLTNTELRASAVPVSFSAGGIATDNTIEELQAIEQRLKLLNANIQRLSFDATSQLRVLVSSLPTLSTVTTVGTMTTGNIGLSDFGKPATAILMSRQTFNLSTGSNFIRS